jgi:hypothetical protein
MLEVCNTVSSSHARWQILRVKDTRGIRVLSRDMSICYPWSKEGEKGKHFNVPKGSCFLLSKRCNQQLGKESSKIWPFTATAQEVYFILWNTNNETYVLYLMYHCMIWKRLCMLGLFHNLQENKNLTKYFYTCIIKPWVLHLILLLLIIAVLCHYVTIMIFLIPVIKLYFTSLWFCSLYMF